MHNIGRFLMIILFFLSLSTSASAICFAEDKQSVEFYSSNNTGQINLSTAYHRLNGKEQRFLLHTIISVLQKNHIEQGRFKPILGTYRMQSTQQITADNTEVFIASPYQSFTSSQIFSLAKELARALKQESVAVFIPSQGASGNEVELKFISYLPTITEVTTLIQTKLPSIYSQAFSLVLKQDQTDFAHARVSKVKWLGNKIDCSEIKKAFPREVVQSQHGDAYLVYQSGEAERL